MVRASPGRGGLRSSRPTCRRLVRGRGPNHYRFRAICLSWGALFTFPFAVVFAGLTGLRLVGLNLDQGWIVSGILLSMVFVLGAGLAIYSAAMTILGYVDVKVTGDQVTVFSGVLGLGRRRKFDLSRVESVLNERKGRGVVIALYKDDDGVERFGNWLPGPRRCYIANVLRWVLTSRKSTACAGR